MPQMSDTRIPLSGLSSQGGGQGSPGPLGTLGALMQIKEQQLRMQQQQREAERQRQDDEDDTVIRQTLSQYERPDDGIKQLYGRGQYRAAMKAGTMLANQRKAEATAYDEQLQSTGRRLDQAGQIAQGITDDLTLRASTPALVQLLEPIYGKSIADVIGTRYDKAHIDALVKAGTKRSEQITAEHNATTEWLDAYNKGAITNPYSSGVLQLPPGASPDAVGAPHSKAELELADVYFKMAGKVLPQAQNKEQWDGYLGMLHKFGMPTNVATMIPQWDDADPDKSRTAARQLGMSVKEQEDAKSARIRAEKAGAPAAAKGLSATRESELRLERTKADKKVEDDMREGGENYWMPATPGDAFSVQDLTPFGKDEYVRRRLQNEDDDRGWHGKPPLLEEAQQALEANDRARYDALSRKFKNISGGLVTLDDALKGSSASSTKATGTPDAPEVPPEGPGALSTAWSAVMSGAAKLGGLTPPPAPAPAPTASAMPTVPPAKMTEAQRLAKIDALDKEFQSLLVKGRLPDKNKARGRAIQAEVAAISNRQ